MPILRRGGQGASARARSPGTDDRRILARTRAPKGLDKSPEFLNRQRRMTEVPADQHAWGASDQRGTAAFNDRHQPFCRTRPNMSPSGILESGAGLSVRDAERQARHRQMAATKSLDDLVKVLSANGIKFVRARNRLDTAIRALNVMARSRPCRQASRSHPVGNQGSPASRVTRPPPLTVSRLVRRSRSEAEGAGRQVHAGAASNPCGKQRRSVSGWVRSAKAQ